MAKLVVNLSYHNQWSSTPTVTSVVANAATAATINYLAASPVTASSTLANVTLTTTTANEKYTAVMVPQSTFQVITVNIDGKQYTYNNDKAISLESGKITTVNLIVGRDKITAKSVTINDWQEGETINGGEAL
jgi:Na+-transporting NADH:ubiquinone oxidoreductase subunit NqrD